MKRLNLEPTDENVIAQFCNDSIGRNIDVLQFVSLLNSIDENCSIAVDALWGAGKTFFVKQVKMVLDAYNNFTTSIADSGKTEITNACEKAYQCQEFSDHPQLCVYYDAWKKIRKMRLKVIIMMIVILLYIMMHGKMIMTTSRYCRWFIRL